MGAIRWNSTIPCSAKKPASPTVPPGQARPPDRPFQVLEPVSWAAWFVFALRNGARARVKRLPAEASPPSGRLLRGQPGRLRNGRGNPGRSNGRLRGQGRSFTRFERAPRLPALEPAVVPLSKTLRKPAVIGVVILAFMHARVRSPALSPVVKSGPVAFLEAFAETSPEGVARIGQVGACKGPETKIIGFQRGRPQREQPKDRRNENEAFFHEVHSPIPGGLDGARLCFYSAPGAGFAPFEPRWCARHKS